MPFFTSAAPKTTIYPFAAAMVLTHSTNLAASKPSPHGRQSGTKRLGKVCEKVPRRSRKSPRQLHDVPQRHIPLSSFYPSNAIAIQPSSLGQFLFRKTSLVAKPSHPVSPCDALVPFVGDAGGHVRRPFEQGLTNVGTVSFLGSLSLLTTRFRAPVIGACRCVFAALVAFFVANDESHQLRRQANRLPRDDVNALREPDSIERGRLPKA